MEYKKSELTKFAKDCAWGSKALINGMCMSEEVTHTKIGRCFAHGFTDDEIILEVSKRFAKVVNDQMVPDVENAAVQEFCDIISILVDCCDEHDWFFTVEPGKDR